MAKTYVLDTNVLLHNPEAFFSFEENEGVVPFAVIEEIDNQKKQDEIGRNARTVSRILDAMRSSGRLSDGVRLAEAERSGSSSITRSSSIFPRVWSRRHIPERIDHPDLDAGNNGLSYLVEKLKDEEICGRVTLVKGERSKVAELGAKLL